MANKSNSQDGRGSYAKNGPRDENGQLESKNSSNNSSGKGQSHDGRGSNSDSQQRDSQGRFKSK